ncbi:WG repeat-containing protein [Pseudomonas saponiphila]|uniref:WG containing repeat-containing protein n=1 Tax=Pseudomonas saponiphila TaxID=556534 RepID=A0A1H4LFL1_9PSED|nr:WG repeat-containing protein [Pseudomonas saponiphila]SEB69316.1 WG containing repeat-containing protein [Pseudomonas saponiphila]
MDRSACARLGSLILSLSALTLVGCKEETSPKTAAIAPAPAPAAMIMPICANGECAVLDQDGKVLVSADNDYDAVVALPLDKTFLFAKDGTWNLASADGKQILKAAFTDDLRLLTPGYFGFGQDGKLGIIDQSGKQIQPPRFDDLYVGGNDDFIVYEIGGKRGILSAKGEVITEAVYDSSVVRDDFAKRGGWMGAERGDQKWALNLKTGEQKKVEFDSIDYFANQHLVVNTEQGKALADANAQLISAATYNWMGEPGDGLVAFREKYDSPCGYMDFQGKTVIQAQFSACQVFGKQGALVTAKNADGSSGKAGFIDRQGQWKVQPTYDSADPAGFSPLGMFKQVSGLNQVAVLQNVFSATFGIFDVDKGVELFKPTYTQIGALNADLFVFSTANSPTKQATLFGQATQMHTVGLMDASGKVLLEPGQYVDIRLDASGHYLLATDDTSPLATSALYDLKGKRLIASKWQELVVDPTRGAIFGYAVEGVGDDQSRSLKAVYRLDGTPSFQVSQVECGAEQVRDGQDKVLWPANPQDHCPQPDEEDQGEGDNAQG